MNIWLITAFEPIPSDNVRPMRFMGIADQLVAEGHKVTLWTTSFFHHTKSQRFTQDTKYEVAPGYSVIVLHSWGYRKNISVRRFFAHRHFAWRLSKSFSKLPKPDIILTSLPPLDSVSTVVDYGLKQGVPVVVDIIDPWPDVFLTIIPSVGRSLGRLLLLPLYAQLRYIIINSSAVTSISNTYINWVEDLAGGQIKRKAVFYPAVDICAFDQLIKKRGGGIRSYQSERLRFVYAGALGGSYDVETVIACARLLAWEGFEQAEFLIAGSGPKEGLLRNMAKGLPNVKLLGWLGAKNLAVLFSESHVGIACYKSKATQSVSYKLFDYLAAGLPIFCSLPGEMSNLIEQHQIGKIYEAENPESLAALVKDICNQPVIVRDMGKRARHFAEKWGDSRIVYKRMAKFIGLIAERLNGAA